MSIFLTQALLEFETAARLGLHDVYDWHQLVWKAFPGRDGQPRDFLTRLDRRERERALRLLIVSPRAPVRPETWPGDAAAWQTREIPPAFFASPHYRFQLRANPTKRDNATRRRLPLRTDDQLRAWLLRKAEAAGFAVDADSLHMMQEGREWFAKSGHQGSHHAVEFEGRLAVTDRTRFAAAFARGIGSAKAFGFGLLALAPTADAAQTPWSGEGRAASPQEPPP
ncbi:MAG: CRISPR system Cascade subunit CasE [Lentisphaerae bacterium ADurb.BinA184]|nr:MAG: CRISPR system Cascade subunit CasE [Lentisphaerae bacterium ADurb.BinA184]